MPQAIVEYRTSGNGVSAANSALITVASKSDMSIQREVEKRHPGKTIDIIAIKWK